MVRKMCDTVVSQTWDVVSTHMCENVVCNKIILQPESLVLTFNSTILSMYYPLALIFMLRRQRLPTLPNNSTKWSYVLRCKNDSTAETEELLYEYNDKDISCALSKYQHLTDILIKTQVLNNSNEVTTHSLDSRPKSMSDPVVIIEAGKLLLLGGFIIFIIIIVCKIVPPTVSYYRKKLDIIKNDY